METLAADPARRFEEALNTGARIYVKYEGVSPVGSHKANSAVAQAYYNSIDGVLDGKF